MEEKLLNISEVAEYLKLKRDQVEALVASGDLPAYKIGGTLLRFKKDQIERFRRKRTSALAEKKMESFEQEGLQQTSSGAGAYIVPGSRPGGGYSRHAGAIRYGFWERLEDFLYYNDFYILSFIILVLVLLAVFGY